jgi:hypothetical protein
MCSLANTNHYSFSSISDTTSLSTLSSSRDMCGDRFISTRVATNEMCSNFETKSEIFSNMSSSQFYSDKSCCFGPESSNQENQSGISNSANSQFNDENSRLYSTLL